MKFRGTRASIGIVTSVFGDKVACKVCASTNRKCLSCCLSGNFKFMPGVFSALYKRGSVKELYIEVIDTDKNCQRL